MCMRFEYVCECFAIIWFEKWHSSFLISSNKTPNNSREYLRISENIREYPRISENIREYLRMREFQRGTVGACWRSFFCRWTRGGRTDPNLSFKFFFPSSVFFCPNSRDNRRHFLCLGIFNPWIGLSWAGYICRSSVLEKVSIRSLKLHFPVKIWMLPFFHCVLFNNVFCK